MQNDASKPAGAGCQVHTGAAANALPVQDNVAWRPVKPAARTEHHECHLLVARECTTNCTAITLARSTR